MQWKIDGKDSAIGLSRFAMGKFIRAVIFSGYMPEWVARNLPASV